MLKEHERQYVVGTNTGGFPLPSNFEMTFKLFLKKANISDKGVLSTRHTYATKLIRTKKVPLRVISKALCDRSEKVTRDIYIHICREELEDLYEAVEDMYEMPETDL